jgi:moderate conductance mechanosensitive channel
MLDPVINLLNDQTPLFAPWGRVVVVVGLFALAWLVSRAAATFAARLLVWHDRRHADFEERMLGEKIATMKRRETAVAIVRTSIAYVAFTVAIVLSIAQVAGGVDRLAAIAGGIFLVLVAAFIAQRFLIDMIAGFTMFAERWYSVGDTIVIHAAHELQGVVEEVSLRRTRLRAVSGEVINVHNSQINAVKVLPSGVKELALELFVSDRAEGEDVVETAALMVPEGPTTFIRRPWIDHVEELSPSLVRMTLRATIAPGREWLAEDFFPDLLKERSHEGLIVHGPVILAVDERAYRSYARASATTRWNARRAEQANAAGIT